MILKERTISAKFKFLTLVNARTTLSEKETQYITNLIKGYEGEALFDSFYDSLPCDCLILNDLVVKISNATTQMDKVVFFPECIHHYEVKNLEGNYFYETDEINKQDKLFKLPNKEITNPLIQVNRTESLLRQFVQNLGINIPIRSFVVFVNPEFTLYQAPLDKPFLLSSQINRHINELHSISSKLSAKQKLVAQKLLSLHDPNLSFIQIPNYHYDQLNKGIICANCHSFSVSVDKRICLCHHCGHIESAWAAILRSVDEFKLLFPDKKITTNSIFDWCQVISNKKRIYRILEKNYRVVGKNKWSYYE